MLKYTIYIIALIFILLTIFSNFNERYQNQTHISNKNILNLNKNMPVSEQYEIIVKNNEHVLNLLNNELRDQDEINIIAKGPSATYMIDAHTINQSLIFSNKKFVYMNDFESLLGVEDFIKDIKFIFFPEYPHLGTLANPKANFIDFIDYLKLFNFTGNIFIYKHELRTLKPELSYLDKYEFNSMTSTDLPVFILSKFFDKKKFNTYGFKKGPDNAYHTDLEVFLKNQNLNARYKFASVLRKCGISSKNILMYNEKYNNYVKLFQFKKINPNPDKKLEDDYMLGNFYVTKF